MDNILLMADNEKDLQKLLNITKETADKYHIVFGEEKSKVMSMGKRKINFEPTLGPMNLKTTDNYKYLGEIINNKRSLKKQIQAAKRKCEGALQTILVIAGDPTLKGIQMETIWKLVETCITPILTYGCELWAPSKEEQTEINRILDNIIKRILMVPISTPREALYIETGIRDPESIMKQKRIAMRCRLEKTKNETITSIMDIDETGTWKKMTDNQIQSLGLNQANLMTMKKQAQKKIISMAIGNDQQKRMTEARTKKSKIRYLLTSNPNREIDARQQYMNQLNRQQTSIIFKTRTRMIDVKNNFRGKYPDNICRGCGQADETQEHVLNECPSIHQNHEGKTTMEEIFTDDINTLKRSSAKILRIVNKLSQSGLHGTHA